MNIDDFIVKDTSTGREFPLRDSSIYGYRVEDLFILSELLREAKVTPQSVAQFVHDARNAYIYGRLLEPTPFGILCDEIIRREKNGDSVENLVMRFNQ